MDLRSKFSTKINYNGSNIRRRVELEIYVVGKLLSSSISEIFVYAWTLWVLSTVDSIENNSLLAIYQLDYLPTTDGRSRAGFRNKF